MFDQHASAPKHPLRLSNKLFVKALDHAFQVGCQLKLTSFIPGHLVRPLGPTEERFMVDAARLPASLTSRGELRRSCIKDTTTGKTRVELIKDQAAKNNILHIKSDRGTVGWTAWFWSYSHLHLEGTFWWDEPHKIWDGCQAAIKASGLNTLMLTLIMSLNVTTAPWQGASCFGQIKGTSNIFRSC